MASKPSHHLDSQTAFARLFIQYRQRSTLDSLESFGDALAELGVVLDSSTFSHWQCGTRLPKNRRVLVMVLKVLFLHQGLTSVVEANVLLEAARQGHLTPDEERYLFTASRQPGNSPKGPIFLSSVHLVMPSKLLVKLETMAAEHGVSRTTMINSILEERLL